MKPIRNARLDSQVLQVDDGRVSAANSLAEHTQHWLALGKKLLIAATCANSLQAAADPWNNPITEPTGDYMHYPPVTEDDRSAAMSAARSAVLDLQQLNTADGYAHIPSLLQQVASSEDSAAAADTLIWLDQLSAPELFDVHAYDLAHIVITNGNLAEVMQTQAVMERQFEGAFYRDLPAFNRTRMLLEAAFYAHTPDLPTVVEVSSQGRMHHPGHAMDYLLSHQRPDLAFTLIQRHQARLGISPETPVDLHRHSWLKAYHVDAIIGNTVRSGDLPLAVRYAEVLNPSNDIQKQLVAAVLKRDDPDLSVSLARYVPAVFMPQLQDHILKRGSDHHIASLATGRPGVDLSAVHRKAIENQLPLSLEALQQNEPLLLQESLHSLVQSM